MPYINIEVKARTSKPDKIRKLLTTRNARFVGIDNQTDTYFGVPHGRLKLRQGNVENNLIAYHREDLRGVKNSDFDLYAVGNSEQLLNVLSRTLNIIAVVVKKREIYYIDNVKFHLDTVDDHGQFVEIEAGNKDAEHLTIPELRKQCDEYCRLFELADEDFIAESYSDMVMQKVRE